MHVEGDWQKSILVTTDISCARLGGLSWSRSGADLRSVTFTAVQFLSTQLYGLTICFWTQRTCTRSEDLFTLTLCTYLHTTSGSTQLSYCADK